MIWCCLFLFLCFCARFEMSDGACNSKKKYKSAAQYMMHNSQYVELKNHTQ